VKRIVVEIGAGELLDRLSIVEIKTRHAHGEAARRLLAERDDLRRAAGGAGLLTAEFEAALADLRAVNETLWTVEDEIRGCEADCDFGHRFVGLARAVYTNNDRRWRIKRRIDERYGSAVAEEKIYSRARP